ncbi:MAG: cytochrome c oxidase accessory protein CcoG [Alphaproteobacteria bacterium]|nr:cytochrome c oxidase accessory protein CcoG [Alphaproteobacteria bacterium]
MSEIPLEDAESVRSQKEQLPLYAPRVKVFPKRVSGIFRHLKWAALIVLLGIYYIAPWIRWDRGPNQPDQAFLIDMAHRRAYFLWIEIWPQEVYYLAGLLMIGAFGLFLVTALFGRVWCGFTCPQTVWTDLFMWVERLVEGDRTARMRLDRAPWTAGKIAKRTTKHGLWLIISVLTGGAWIMYFNDAPTLVLDILHWQVAPAVVFFIGLFTATTYLLAGFAREQVCTYMCPWPRFQAAMFDEDSLIVTYQGWRGEPRGHHKKGESWDARGDCVACNQCIAVCPTGIDIRDGNQLECIGCGLCIDACNHIMARVGRPANLITYDSMARQTAEAAGKTAHYRLVRPRTLFYLGLLLIVGGFIVYGLWSRPGVEINVLRDRSPLFVTLSDGSIRNGYTLKILNKAREPRAYTLALDGLPNATVTVVGRDAPETIVQLSAAPDAVTTYRLYVRAPSGDLDGKSTPFAFVLQPNPRTPDTPVSRRDVVFRGPDT